MQRVSDASRAPRIWIVLDFRPDKHGALEHNLIALAGRLQTTGAKTTLVFSGPPIETIRDSLQRIGAEVRTLDFRRPAIATMEFARWLYADRPDLVHFHFVRAYSPLVLAAHTAGAQVLVHDHLILGKPILLDHSRPPAVSRALQPAKRFRGAALNGCVDYRVAVSLAVAVSVMNAEYFPSERIEVVPNGIDVSRFATSDSTIRTQLELGERPVVACAVAQMRSEKGVEILIRAMTSIRQDAVLLIAGPPSAACTNLVRERNLEDRVHFLGLRNDVETVFAAADVIVVPSICDEAFCFAAAEGMASGKPVIVTESGGMPELVNDSECGAIIPRNDADALATAISSVLGNPALAKRLGEAARNRAHALYTTERWVASMLRVYGRLLPSFSEDGRVVGFASGDNAVPKAGTATAERSAVA